MAKNMENTWGKYRNMIWLTHGWTFIDEPRFLRLALGTKPTPQIQQALGQSFAILSWSDSSEANTLQPEEHIGCTWLYWALFSRITHLEVSINASTPTIVGLCWFIMDNPIKIDDLGVPRGCLPMLPPWLANQAVGPFLCQISRMVNMSLWLIMWNLNISKAF